VKLGLLPHVPQTSDVALSSVWTPPEAPDNFGTLGLEWGMLGNDRFGDCYWASAAHEQIAQRAAVGAHPQFSEKTVLNAYATYLGTYGYQALEANPEALDRGTEPRAGAKYRRDNGIEDVTGRSHWIGAYAFESDPEKVLSLTYALEAATLCFALPQSAEDAFDAEEPVWDVEPGSKIVGGHAVAAVGAKDGKLVGVSWGKEVTITDAFLAKYLQTTVIYFSRATLDSTGKTPLGLDKSKLVQLVCEVREP
jgi:hypothetical protein